MAGFPGEPIALHWPRLRWLIAALLLLLSVLNYVDRQALSILATTIQVELSLTDRDYARIGQAFLLCYTLSYLAAGRIVDRVGPRWAETIFVTWWSIANMLTALATGFWSLLAFRGLLGLGESGHYAVAAKTVGLWFPPRERGIAVGMYTMGGTLGAAIAAPLVAWITLKYGWRSAFLATGAGGVVLAAIWSGIYRTPASPISSTASPHFSHVGSFSVGLGVGGRFVPGVSQVGKKSGRLRSIFRGWGDVFSIAAQSGRAVGLVD